MPLPTSFYASACRRFKIYQAIMSCNVFLLYRCCSLMVTGRWLLLLACSHSRATGIVLAINHGHVFYFFRPVVKPYSGMVTPAANE